LVGDGLHITGVPGPPKFIQHHLRKRSSDVSQGRAYNE
jgi:hypothetical protein